MDVDAERMQMHLGVHDEQQKQGNQADYQRNPAKVCQFVLHKAMRFL